MSIIDKFYQFINKQEDEEPIDADVLDLEKEDWTEEDIDKAQDVILNILAEYDAKGIEYDDNFLPITEDEDDEEIQKSLLKQDEEEQGDFGGDFGTEQGQKFPGYDVAERVTKKKPAPEGVQIYETKAGALWYYRPGKQKPGTPKSKPRALPGAGRKTEAAANFYAGLAGTAKNVSYAGTTIRAKNVPQEQLKDIILHNTNLSDWQIQDIINKWQPDSIYMAKSPNSPIQLIGKDANGDNVILQNVPTLQKHIMRAESIDDVVEEYTDGILEDMSGQIQKKGVASLSDEDKAYFIYTNLGMRHGNGEAFAVKNVELNTFGDPLITTDFKRLTQSQQNAGKFTGNIVTETTMKTQGVGLLDLTPRNIQFLDDDKKVVIDVSGEQAGKAGVPTRYEIDDPNMIAVIKSKMIREAYNDAQTSPIDANKINFSKKQHLDKNGNVKAYIKDINEQVFDGRSVKEGRITTGDANRNNENQKNRYREAMGQEVYDELNKKFNIDKHGISAQSSRRWKAGKEARAIHGDILADWESGKLGKLTHKEYLDKIAEHVSKKVTQHLTRDKDGNLVPTAGLDKKAYIQRKIFNLLTPLQKEKYLTDIMTDDEVSRYLGRIMPSELQPVQKSEALTYATGIFNSILNKGWMTNPRGADDSYKKKKLKKEGDGGGFGDGGGTVFTSSDSGVFTPTHSERGTRKKNENKKKTGIERLEQFVSGNSPERKMVKADAMFTLELVNWVRKELRKGEFRQQGSGESINDQPPRIDWKKKDVDIPEDKDEVLEFDAEPDDQADVTQNGETERIKELDDEEENEKPKDTGAAGDAAPAGVNVQLAYESGGYEADALRQGGSKDLEQEDVDDPADEHENEEFVKSFLKDLEILKNYYEGEDETES